MSPEYMKGWRQNSKSEAMGVSHLFSHTLSLPPLPLNPWDVLWVIEPLFPSNIPGIAELGWRGRVWKQKQSRTCWLGAPKEIEKGVYQYIFRKSRAIKIGPIYKLNRDRACARTHTHTHSHRALLKWPSCLKTVPEVGMEGLGAGKINLDAK